MDTRPLHVDSVGIRELRSGLASLVRRAAQGDTIIVTVDGRPTAQLGPLTPGQGVSVGALVAAGRLVAPERHDHPAPPEPAVLPVDFDVDRALDDVRR